MFRDPRGISSYITIDLLLSCAWPSCSYGGDRAVPVAPVMMGFESGPGATPCNDCVKVQGWEGEGAGRAGGPCLRGSRGAECAADPCLLRPNGLAADATFPYRSPER